MINRPGIDLLQWGRMRVRQQQAEITEAEVDAFRKRKQQADRQRIIDGICPGCGQMEQLRIGPKCLGFRHVRCLGCGTIYNLSPFGAIRL